MIQNSFAATNRRKYDNGAAEATPFGQLFAVFGVLVLAALLRFVLAAFIAVLLVLAVV